MIKVGNQRAWRGWDFGGKWQFVMGKRRYVRKDPLIAAMHRVIREQRKKKKLTGSASRE
jgi:hypothetical protein